ncbi:GDSL-type esterase/lipase family protein [Curtobacterium sp. AB7]|uniref:GDSL-type esterase/lipase family protein n=1 Tax=Curtobacterium sp. AB7 TaxID=3349327 RepID=UPI003836B801
MRFKTTASLHQLGWSLVRPVLHLRLWYFRALVGDTVYLPPVDGSSPSERSDRVLLMGSTDAVRVGVIRDELTTLSHIATHVASKRHRPFVWAYTGRPVLTVRQAAQRPLLGVETADAVLIVLGFSDVLLMTATDRWERDLFRIIAAIRSAAGDTRGIVIAGLAPMDEFRYTARFGRRRIRRQVEQLNHASARVAARVSHCAYVPPPVFPEAQGRPGDEQYSWALIHRMWGTALAPAVVSALRAHDR